MVWTASSAAPANRTSAVHTLYIRFYGLYRSTHNKRSVSSYCISPSRSSSAFLPSFFCVVTYIKLGVLSVHSRDSRLVEGLLTQRFGAATLTHLLSYTLSLRLYLPSYLLLTYLLTPWSRVLLQKVTGSQLVKKFPAFYGT